MSAGGSALDGQAPVMSALIDAVASGHSQAASVGHVARQPVGIELLLVESHALEVVPLLAALEQQRGQPLAHVRAAVLADGCQRRHARD